MAAAVLDKAHASDELVQHLVADLSARWATGERPSAAEYVSRYPELRSNREAVLRLLYEQVYLADQYGVAATAEQICMDLPAYRQDIHALLFFHRLLSP